MKLQTIILKTRAFLIKLIRWKLHPKIANQQQILTVQQINLKKVNNLILEGNHKVRITKEDARLLRLAKKKVFIFKK